MNRQPWSNRRFITMVVAQLVWIAMFMSGFLSESAFLWLTGGTVIAYMVGEGALSILDKVRGNDK